MARPVYVGGFSGKGTGASYTVSLSGTLTGGVASSPSEGDLIIVCTGFGGTASSAPTCSGNTSGTYQNVHAALYSNDTWDTNMRTFYQFAGATPDTTLTIGRVSNAAYGGVTVVHVWRNVNQTTPIDVTAATSATNNQSASRPNPPSHTPTTPEAVVIACGVGMQTTAGGAFTIPSGMTNGVSDFSDGTTSDCGAFICSFDWTSNAYDPSAATGGTTSTSGSWAAATFSLRPGLNEGDFAASESGDDTASISGDVIVQGNSESTETGADAFAADGTITDPVLEVNGALDVTESGLDVMDAGGEILVSGALSASESVDDVIASSGLVVVSGNFSITESLDELIGSGFVLVSGAFDATETGGDVFFTGLVENQQEASREVKAGSRNKIRAVRFVARFKGEDYEFETLEELEDFVKQATQKPKKSSKKPKIKIVIPQTVKDEFYKYDLPSIEASLSRFDWDSSREIWNRYKLLSALNPVSFVQKNERIMADFLKMLELEDEELLLL